MNKDRVIDFLSRQLPFFILLSVLSTTLWAHGGVSVEDNMCVLRIGPYKAHFAGYQPEARGDQEFCDDVPVKGKAIFAIDFIDNELRSMQTEFRILRDVKNVGINATYQDLGSKQDIDNATILTIPGKEYPRGTITIRYDFPKEGHFIGLAISRRPGTSTEYISVFPFSVGIFRYGQYIWSLLAVIVVSAVIGGILLMRGTRRKPSSA